MSNTTTCISAINHASGIGQSTVDKLYSKRHTQQPSMRKEKPISMWKMSRYATLLDIAVNHSIYAKSRNDVDVISYHIWGDVYVSYIKEGGRFDV